MTTPRTAAAEVERLDGLTHSADYSDLVDGGFGLSTTVDAYLKAARTLAALVRGLEAEIVALDRIAASWPLNEAMKAKDAYQLAARSLRTLLDSPEQPQ